MALLKSKFLFFTTSPRSPLKMIPEIHLLIESFSGQKWNKNTQIKFSEQLRKSDYFEGKCSEKHKDFSARDRINRAPKSLGFVDLVPAVSLTDAGKLFISGKQTEEILLRQMLKFQLPSPYHKETSNTKNIFYVKPYLEILRLIYTLKSISFDELMIFGMQIVDYRKFSDIVKAITLFRKEKYTESYKQHIEKCMRQIIISCHSEEISQGNTHTRESSDASLKKFIKTKRNNLRDYTDACIRYLRATGLIAISHHTRMFSIMPHRIQEVEYLLANIDPTPVFISDEKEYKKYLFSNELPVLYSDDKNNLIDSILRNGFYTKAQLCEKPIFELKKILDSIIQQNKKTIISTQISQLKSYALYSDVIDTFNTILTEDCYDAPLILEWNTWRALTMLNGGKVIGNFNIDDAGQPMSTAQGNMPDIICCYDDFELTIEVTMQRGQRQYETESEPVARHLAKHKKNVNKPTYCLFIAPHISDATIAHFFILYKTNVSFYEGISVIVPLELGIFMKMVENSYSSSHPPTPIDIQKLFLSSIESAKSAKDEKEWFEIIQKNAFSWMIAS